MILRAAALADLQVINPLILRSKAHWGYDAEFMQACIAELTITQEDVTTTPAVVSTISNRVTGFARISLTGVAVLEELFVDPDAMGQGAGGELFNWCADMARAAGYVEMILDSDPQAEPFYLAMGAIRTGFAPSESISNRYLPQMSFEL